MNHYNVFSCDAQELYCVATCIDCWPAMLYTLSMSPEIETEIYNFYTLVATKHVNGFSQGRQRLSEYVINLSESDVTMTVKFQFGITNLSVATIEHSDYKIKYTRTWPDWNINIAVDRLWGSHEYAYTGDIEVFRQHLLFITLSTS